jgi:hypothetical protein
MKITIIIHHIEMLFCLHLKANQLFIEEVKLRRGVLWQDYLVIHFNIWKGPLKEETQVGLMDQQRRGEGDPDAIMKASNIE